MIIGPFQSVRGMKDGDEVKVEGSPAARPRTSGRQRSHAAIPRSRRARPPGHLGEQAAVAAHGSGQHRGGDVDHRRGVARAGPERLRGRVDRVAVCGRHVCRHADTAELHRRGHAARPEQSACHPARRSRDSSFGAERRVRHGRVEVRRRSEVSRRNARQHFSPGRHERIPEHDDDDDRVRPADHAGRVRRRTERRHRRVRHCRSALRGDRPDRQNHHDFRRALSHRRRRRQERRALRPVAGRVRRHPARRVSARLRVAAIAASSPSSRATRRWSERRWTRRRVALRIERRLRPKERDNFGAHLGRHVPQHLELGAPR